MDGSLRLVVIGQNIDMACKDGSKRLLTANLAESLAQTNQTWESTVPFPSVLPHLLLSSVGTEILIDTVQDSTKVRNAVVG